MNPSTSVNEILNSIANLSVDEQNYIADIVNHRLHAMQRKQLADRVKEAELQLAKNQVMTGSADDFLAMLKND